MGTDVVSDFTETSQKVIEVLSDSKISPAGIEVQPFYHRGAHK